MYAYGIVTTVKMFSEGMGIPLDKLIVGFDAAECLYSFVEEASVIDIFVPDEEWNNLLSAAIVHSQVFNGQRGESMYFKRMDIHILRDHWNGAFSTGEVVRGGIHCLRILDLIAAREKLGRDKDFERIKLIKAKLGV